MTGKIDHVLFEDESMIRDYQAIQKAWFLRGKQHIIQTTGKHRGVKLLATVDYGTGKIVWQEDEQYTAETFSFFMLKADQIDEDDPFQLALYERMLLEGIYYNGRKYVRSIKSPAMGRTQRTEFIQEKYVRAWSSLAYLITSIRLQRQEKQCLV